MVYKRKPDLSKLPEFSAKVWVHDPDGSKLDWRAKVGHWVGFDDASSGHRIYFEGRRTIAVERSVKLDRDDVLVPIPDDLLFEGENEDDNQPSSEDSNQNTHQTPVPSVVTPATVMQSSPQTQSRTPPTSTPLPALPSIQKLTQALVHTDPLGPNFEEQSEEEAPTGRGQRVRKPSATNEQPSIGSCGAPRPENAEDC
ncbi:hypothetical protein C8R43DRAFT_962242 [Mycena crocata]|nr:hypothetical protein C8R43DRAFT_962242 [Mycena crocata]